MCCCRFLVSTEAAELPVAVILNKADLVPQQQCDEAVREVRRCWTQLCHGSVPAVSGCHAERLLLSHSAVQRRLPPGEIGPMYVLANLAD